jgi:hypothetical protein
MYESEREIKKYTQGYKEKGGGKKERVRERGTGGEQIALLKPIMAALFFINSLTHPYKQN